MELRLLINALSLIVIKMSTCFWFYKEGLEQGGAHDIRLVICPLGMVVTRYDSVNDSSLEPSHDPLGWIIYSEGHGRSRMMS